MWESVEAIGELTGGHMKLFPSSSIDAIGIRLFRVAIVTSLLLAIVLTLLAVLLQISRTL
jgi:hypothetical protein